MFVPMRVACFTGWVSFPPSIIRPELTEKVNFPIAPVDQFIDLMEGVEKVEGSTLDITKDEAAGGMRVVILDPEL